MGSDGANQGISRMKAAGAVATPLPRDEASSVIFGMPKQAIATGAVDIVLPLEGIPGHLIKAMQRAGAPLKKPAGSPLVAART